MYKLLAVMALFLLAVSCKLDDVTHGFGSQGSIRINRNEVSLAVGEEIRLNLSFNSRSTGQKDFTWSSENPQIVSVASNSDKSGTIKALAEGTTRIKVESDDKTLSAACQVEVNAAGAIKILAIGNSFSEDAIENYLYDLAKAAGKTVIIGNMYIGGSALADHVQNATNDLPAYEYRKINKDGVKTGETNISLADALADENWDYISFQEVSQYSGIFSYFEASLPTLLEYVKGQATNPNVRYILHQTWAYARTSTHEGFANYDKDQGKMYNAIVDAVGRAADLVDIGIVIPAGTAIQNGRTSVIGDNFCRDGYHLDLNIGRYTAACAWFEKLFNIDVTTNVFKPVALSNYDAEIARHAAHYAVLRPKEVTVLVDYQHEAPNEQVLVYPVYLDFGINISGTPWNNMSSYNSGKLADLLDGQGTPTGINIELTDAFSGDNTLGPENNTLGLPAQVSNDAFWGSATDNVSGGFTISRLNKAQRYNFSIYGSRKDVSDNRETAYIISGANEGTGYLNASGNVSRSVTIENIKPKDDGTITVRVTAGQNNNNGLRYYYINSIIIYPVQ